MIDEVLAQRQKVLEQMDAIRSMKAGSVSKQFMKVKLKGNEEAVLRGPYFVLCQSEGGKTVSRRLSAEERVHVEQDVAAYKRFGQLCKEFCRLTERLGELERLESESESLKKTPKSRLPRTMK
jgi:hypothetical protein